MANLREEAIGMSCRKHSIWIRCNWMKAGDLVIDEEKLSRHTRSTHSIYWHHLKLKLVVFITIMIIVNLIIYIFALKKKLHTADYKTISNTQVLLDAIFNNFNDLQIVSAQYLTFLMIWKKIHKLLVFHTFSQV